ncbi:uncharacterized protein EV154DRAFT_570817 [Mucor mucedo]|uniref:uncharacterized protein n=1 Tax=Mucor mucedo TaxID=29922 RepID=UPI00221F0DC7|nr:uncharacterized protein EV154DRAFT_570817 [Mucor mucedo]KAI7870889.1 hypothetical protein EV154DRAFT_570817 [Mucor mucedo]
MNPLYSKPIYPKRRVIRNPEEEGYEVVFEHAEETLREVQPAPKKPRRGRPPKITMSVESPIAESSGPTYDHPALPISSSLVLSQSRPLGYTCEFELEIKALPMKVRGSTAAIYGMPLENWKDVCEKNRHRYPVDPMYRYTVGPTEFVVAFFKESVFKRTYNKSVSIENDVRTQIGLRTEDNVDNQPSLRQMANNAPSNKNGTKKVIESSRREVEWSSPKKTKKIIELIKKYEHDLVYDQVQTNVDRASHCVIRDSCKSGELIRILKSLWISSANSGVREMFSISSRHHMLRRDQDLRNLNFADCFCTIIPKTQHKGIQQALALVFSLDKGKTLKEGEVKFACAMRHENVSGDFLNEDRWHNWKVLRGRISPEKSLSGGSQWKTAKKALADEEIFTTRVTHCSRHAGSMEAEGLGIPFDLIKRVGRWKDRLGRLKTHYLARNTVSPSLELQRTIFPRIESYFGVGSVEWEAACDNKMKEIDEKEDEDDNVINMEIRSQADPVEFNSIETAKRGFLRLLIRCRRIILQDAAIYLYMNKENKHVSNDKRLFSNYQFKMFEQDVIAAINSPSIDRLEEHEGLAPNILDTDKEVARRVAEAARQISHLQHQQDNRFEKFEISFNNYVNQNNQQNVPLMNMNQQLTKDLRIRMMQRQCLNSQMQLMMATNNAFTNSNANNNLTQPQNFPALQMQSFPTIPMQSFPTIPMQSLPAIPNSQHPVTIQPAIASTNANQKTATSPKQKERAKKARWVSYEPTNSE